MSSKTALSNQFTVSVGELEPLLRQAFLRPEAHRRPINMVGPPGIGKTHVIDQLVDNLRASTGKDIGQVTFIASMMDITDFRIPAIVKEGGKSVMQFFTTDELPFQCHGDRFPEEGVIFLDEWTNTEPAIQKMLLQLLQRGILGKETLKPGWRIIAAGNRTTDRTFSNHLSLAAANRCVNLYITPPKVDDWIAWAFAHDVDESVCAYIRSRPDHLFAINHDLYQSGELGQPTPRTWEGVSQLVKDNMAQHALVYGLVGNGFGGEFLAFRELRSELPDLDAIAEGKYKGDAPKKPDVQFSTVMGLVYRTEEKTINNIVPFIMKFSTDFQVLYGRDLARKNPRLLSSSPAVAEMLKKWKP